MRDNMLINPSGLDGHAMEIDKNIEHLIDDLKEQFSSKGIYSNWDRLGNISACVHHIQALKKHVSKSVKASYQGSTHSDVDTSNLAWRIANKAQELQLQVKLSNRPTAFQPKPVIDLRKTGRQKFESASLAQFNKKIEEMKVGIPVESEIDDIGPPDFHLVQDVERQAEDHFAGGQGQTYLQCSQFP